MEQKLLLRKRVLDQTIQCKRMISSFNQVQTEMIDEEKEELLVTGIKNYPLTNTRDLIGKRNGKRDVRFAKIGATKKKVPQNKSETFFGANREGRTPDLSFTKALLCLLSYVGKKHPSVKAEGIVY